MKLIAFRINQPRGQIAPAIEVFFNQGFAENTGITSPDVGRLIFEFDAELLSSEFSNAASPLRAVYEKPEDAVEVKFEEISRSTTGFELKLNRVESETLTPYDSPLVCVVSADV